MKNGQRERRGDRKGRERKDAGGRSREEREKSGDVAMETKVGHREVGIGREEPRGGGEVR